MNRKIGVVLSYILMIFEVLSTLLLTPFIISTLGNAEYGVYKLSASVSAYLLLLDMGLGNAVTRYISKFRANNDLENSRKFLGVATIYYVGIAVVALLLGTVLVRIFPTVFAVGLSAEEIILGQQLLSITMINVAVTLGTAAYMNVIIAYEHFAFSKLTSIVQILVRMILIVVALKCNMGSKGLVLTNLATTVLCRGVFVCYTLFKLKLRPLFRNINFSFIKDIIAYSTWILLQMIATQINALADQIMLGILVPAASTIIAVYCIGTQIVQYFQSIGSAFTGVLMPGVVKLVEHNATAGQLCQEMIRIGRIILMVLALIWSGFLVFGQQFVVLWTEEANAQAYYVTAILMTAYMLILTQSIGTQILWAKSAHKEQSILKIGVVLLNILLTIVLIQWNPLIGATIGTFISLFIGDVLVMNIVFVKKIGISLKQYYKGLFHGIAPCVSVTLAVGFLFRLLHLSGWGGLVINIMVICLVYGIAMLMYGMNAYEKSLVRAVLIKTHLIRNT